VADFAALDPTVVGHIQLNDVPMPAVIENYMEEALYERRAPGDGDLPLREFLQHVPRAVVIGLEIPIRSQAERGMGPRERLTRCVAQARAMMQS
jgi:sugar phosphate isomerase/epimerase